MKKSHVLLAILVGVGLLIVLLNCQVSINQGINYLLHRRSMAQYKSLTSGDISSENYVIRHLVHDRMLDFGNDDNKILIDTLTENFIVKSVKRYDEADTTIFYYLWKINNQGSIIDSFTVYQGAFLFKPYGYLLQFNDDSYNDWMRTGNKSFHAVSEVINADTLMGEDDLLQKFNLMKSEGQLLGHLTNDTIVKYYFEINNRITVLYGLCRHKDFDDDCKFDQVTLDKRVPNPRFVFMDVEAVSNRYMNNEGDVEPNTSFYLYIEHFLYLKKLRWYLNGLVYIPTRYQGVAFINLHYKNAKFKFKAYAIKIERYRSDIMVFYSDTRDVPLFFVVDQGDNEPWSEHRDEMFAPNGVFEQEGIHYAKETGLYVVVEK